LRLQGDQPTPLLLAESAEQQIETLVSQPFGVIGGSGQALRTPALMNVHGSDSLLNTAYERQEVL
jgi:hypothetical protein